MTRCRYPAALKTRLSSAPSLVIVKLMSKWYILIIAFVYLFIFTAPIHAATYYVSPTGNDSSAGTSTSSPWATFNHAWQNLYPGDTLYLMNGIYKQALSPNVRSGQAGNPITIKAQNPGQATVDGNYDHIPVSISGEYFVVEDLLVQHSGRTAPVAQHLVDVLGNHNTFRR